MSARAWTRSSPGTFDHHGHAEAVRMVVSPRRRAAVGRPGRSGQGGTVVELEMVAHPSRTGPHPSAWCTSLGSGSSRAMHRFGGAGGPRPTDPDAVSVSGRRSGCRARRGGGRRGCSPCHRRTVRPRDRSRPVDVGVALCVRGGSSRAPPPGRRPAELRVASSIFPREHRLGTARTNTGSRMLPPKDESGTGPRGAARTLSRGVVPILPTTPVPIRWRGATTYAMCALWCRRFPVECAPPRHRVTVRSLPGRGTSGQIS